MYEVLNMYLVFFKIGAVSFGGGYAMLPLIEEEVIEKMHYLTDSQFLDILAISQITPGPIAINSATFIGLRELGIIGSIFATLGIVSGPFIFMSIVNNFLTKFKNSKVIERILLYIRPITVALILSAFASTFKKSVIDIKTTVIFAISFGILLSKKVHPIAVIFIFGFLGIVSTYLFNV